MLGRRDDDGLGIDGILGTQKRMRAQFQAQLPRLNVDMVADVIGGRVLPHQLIATREPFHLRLHHQPRSACPRAPRAVPMSADDDQALSDGPPLHRKQSHDRPPGPLASSPGRRLLRSDTRPCRRIGSIRRRARLRRGHRRRLMRSSALAPPRHDLAPRRDTHGDYMMCRIQHVDPGIPRTWVVPAHVREPPWLTGGRSSIAVRLTSHPVAAALCREVGTALVSTSANRHGQPAAITSADVLCSLAADIDFVLDSPVGRHRGPMQIIDAMSGCCEHSLQR